MPPKYKNSTSGNDTKVTSETKTSSRPPQFSEIVRQKLQSPRKDSIQKSQEKQTLNSSCPNERKPIQKDELVRHMSKLPGYLQKVEKRENFQDKALNFGVLDWNLLEKWKYSDNGLPHGNADVGRSCSIRQKRQPQSCSSRPYPTKGKGFSQDIDFSRRIIEKEFEASLRNTCSKPKNISRIKSDKGMRTEIDRIVVTEKGTSSSKFRKNEVANSGIDVISQKVNPVHEAPAMHGVRGGVTSERRKLITSRVELQKTSGSLDNRSSPNEQKRPVIMPKNSLKSNSQDIVNTSEPNLCVYKKSKEANNPKHAQTLNVGSCSSETQTVSPRYKCEDSQTPNSMPVRGNEVDTPSRRFSFSFGKVIRSSSFKENSAVPVPTTPPVVRSEPSHRFSSGEFHSCPLPIGSNSKSERSTRIQSLTCVNKTPKKQPSEDGIRPNDFDAVQGRQSSPNRRFGFGLAKMKRSLSFKEDINIPQSDNAVTSNENKDSLHRKSRSSPLRRLLDPILKTMVTHPCPSTETSPLLKQNLNLVLENEFSNNTKSVKSVVQALLQVTTKNGLPLFKLVVNNSSDILVAMKNITPPGKFDLDSIYTFYSVHEMKRKSSGWINQVHKEKTYGFGYNVVGQMKGFKHFCAESSIDNFGKDRYTRKEFVLYSVDCKQGDGIAPELVPQREIAAIIVKVPYERNISKELTGKEFSELLDKRSEKFHDTTLILSGADHGLPKNGVPSSLIQRWRSGGGCDCGGWDVGCKLEILTNEDQRCHLPERSASSSNRERFDLFDQGGAHDNKPIFSLAPFKKEIYSIEFSSSISLLQALSTCIAAISSRQSFTLSEINFPSDGKLVEELTFLRSSGIRITSKPQEKSAKYVPSPPISPVGRV